MSEFSETIDATQGETCIFDVQVRDEDENPVSYTGTEPLFLLIWPGDDQPAIEFADPTTTTTWLDASKGQIRVRIAPADTTALEAVTYLGRVRILDGADYVGAYSFRLAVAGQPGTGAEYKNYCSYNDMMRHASWIGSLQGSSDVSGFSEQRAMARDWLDDAILACYRPNWWGYGASGTPFGVRSSDWLIGNNQPDPWMRDQLDSDGLIVRSWVREATARYAVHLVCEPILGEERGTSYQALANNNLILANAIVLSNVAEIDLPDSDGKRDGKADLWVNLSVASTR